MIGIRLKKTALTSLIFLTACGGTNGTDTLGAQGFLVAPRNDIVVGTIALDAAAGQDGDVFRVEANGDFVAEIDGRIYRVPADLEFDTYPDDNDIPNVDGFEGAGAGGEFYSNGEAVAFAGYISDLSDDTPNGYYVFAGFSGVDPAPVPESDAVFKGIYRYQEEAILNSEGNVSISGQRGPIWLRFSFDSQSVTEIVPRDGASFQTEPKVLASVVDGQIVGTFGFEGPDDPFNGRDVPLQGGFFDNTGETDIFANFGDSEVSGVIFPDDTP